MEGTRVRTTWIATLLLSLTIGLSMADSTTCPDKMVCLTIAAAQAMRVEQERATLKIEDLEYDNARLKYLAKRPSRVWLQGGIEFLPNLDDHYEPYLLGGINLGRVTLWGGAFGDEPVIGLGWRFF